MSKSICLLILFTCLTTLFNLAEERCLDSSIDWYRRDRASISLMSLEFNRVFSSTIDMLGPGMNESVGMKESPVVFRSSLGSLNVTLFDRFVVLLLYLFYEGRLIRDFTRPCFSCWIRLDIGLCVSIICRRAFILFSLSFADGRMRRSLS